MIRTLTLLGGAGVLGLGCTGTTYDYGGYKTFEYFALDGNRAWEYVSDDAEVEWKLEVTKILPIEELDNKQIVTLEYAKQDPVEYLHSIKWSSDSGDGIQVHDWEQDGSWIGLEDPITIAEYQMVPDEVVESSGAGYDFSTTFKGVETCPNHWISSENTWDCLVFEIDDGDGDDMSGPPFAGTWWLAKGWGASRFIPTGYDEPWVLSDGDWSADGESE